jgi:O-antigen ligase
MNGHQTQVLQFPGDSGSPSRVVSFCGIFFALTGALTATSILNVGNSGISFFYLVFPLPFISLIFPRSRFASNDSDKRSLGITLLISTVIAALLATTTLQLILLNSIDPKSEIVHLLSRLGFLLYFVISQRYLRGEILTRSLLWLRRFLIAFSVYGVYQVPAKLLGLPLFLDWLRNNRSFDMYAYDTAGWIGTIRATSIYAEPSQATIPLLVLFMLNVSIKASTASKVGGWAALVLFTIVSFSRTAWIAVFAVALVVFLFRLPKFPNMVLARHSTIMAATLLILFLSPVWGFLDAGDNPDLSAQERSGGVVLGLHMIKDAPILGYGWNSFENVSPLYANVDLSASSSIDFLAIHNMVVSYAQQAGLSGLLLAALPFLLLIQWSTAPPWMTCGTLVSFLVAAGLGDIGYSSLTWLWLALLLNVRFAKEVPQINMAPALPSLYKSQMSALPYSTS